MIITDLILLFATNSFTTRLFSGVSNIASLSVVKVNVGLYFGQFVNVNGFDSLST